MSVEGQAQPWCVFVTGSRDLEWEKHWTLVRDKLRPFDVPRSAVIHGAGGGRNGRPGCDEITDRAADQFGFRVLRFPALWDLQRRAAGPIRNRLCVDTWVAHQRAGYRLACLAFSTGGTGTEGALLLAKGLSAGLELVQIERIGVTL